MPGDGRVDAVMLESMIQEQMDLDLIPKIAQALAQHAGEHVRARGHLREDDAGLRRAPVARDYAGDHAFRGRTKYFSISIPIPMKDVAAHDKQDLTIQKDDRGRLHSASA